MAAKFEDIFKDPVKAQSLYNLWPSWFMDRGVMSYTDLNLKAINGVLSNDDVFMSFIKW